MKTRLDIEKELTGFVGKQLLCPDGEIRTLKTFECGRNEVTTLHWREGMPAFTEYRNAEFISAWPTYEPVRKPDAPVSMAQLAEVTKSPALAAAEVQAASMINTGDVVALLREQMQKVRQNSAAIPQAKTMGDLAKQIIEAQKLTLEAIKVVHQINTPVKA